ncbi:unnamed protein product [Discosporangium mesarthrocarpum]
MSHNRPVAVLSTLLFLLLGKASAFLGIVSNKGIEGGVLGGHPFIDARSRGHGQGVVMMAQTAPGRTKAELKDEFFRCTSGMVTFGSTQGVEAPIPGASIASMEEYLLRDPSRVVYACWDNDLIEPLGDGHFRLRLKGQAFLTVSIDMSVDIRMWEEGGMVKCKSTGYSAEEMTQILGRDFTDSFFLEVEGELGVKEVATKVRTLSLKNTILSGNVGVSVGGKMPSLIAATPDPIVRAAALGINQRVLEYVSSTFVSTIANDYRQWVRAQRVAAAA